MMAYPLHILWIHAISMKNMTFLKVWRKDIFATAGGNAKKTLLTGCDLTIFTNQPG